jgi:hypothetical protein
MTDICDIHNSFFWLVLANLAKVNLHSRRTVLESIGHVVLLDGAYELLITNLHILGNEYVVSLYPEVLASM